MEANSMYQYISSASQVLNDEGHIASRCVQRQNEESPIAVLTDERLRGNTLWSFPVNLKRQPTF